MEKDVKHLSHSTPIVVFAHIPLVVGVPGVGLGHAGQCAGTDLPEEVRFRDRAERANSPDDAKGQRKCDLPHGDVNGISATEAWQSRFSRTDESASGAVAEIAWNHRCELRPEPALPGHS
jgi:hypothetical protein